MKYWFNDGTSFSDKRYQEQTRKNPNERGDVYTTILWWGENVEGIPDRHGVSH